MTWREADHPRGRGGRFANKETPGWAEKISAGLPHPLDGVSLRPVRGWGRRAFPGAGQIAAGDLHEHRELWHGQIDVYDSRSSRWIRLDEVRKGRGIDRIQFRGFGPGPAMFSSWTTEYVMVRRAEGQHGA